MCRAIIFVACLMLVRTDVAYDPTSWVTATQDCCGNQIIYHEGETDRRGCHEDGSGGFHCH